MTTDSTDIGLRLLSYICCRKIASRDVHLDDIDMCSTSSTASQRLVGLYDVTRADVNIALRLAMFSLLIDPLTAAHISRPKIIRRLL